MPKSFSPAIQAAPPPTTARQPAARSRARVVVPIAETRTMSLPFLAVDPAPANRILATAIGWSIILHAVVLAIKFIPIDVPRADRGSPLEVALVNAKSVSKPTNAELLAQAHLDGGGNTDADRRAKTPLPVLPRESANATPALASRKVERLEKRSQEMLTQIRSAAAVAPPLPAPDAAPEA